MQILVKAFESRPKRVLAVISRDRIAAREDSDEGAAEKSQTALSPIANKQFQVRDDPVLRKLGTEQLRQVLRAAVSIKTYALCDTRILECFLLCFMETDRPVTFLNGVRYLQALAQRSSQKVLTAKI